MGPIRWIRRIARLAGVTRLPEGTENLPIDPSLLPLDLAEQGSSGLRLG